jgi:hypothetical protein
MASLLRPTAAREARRPIRDTYIGQTLAFARGFGSPVGNLKNRLWQWYDPDPAGRDTFLDAITLAAISSRTYANNLLRPFPDGTPYGCDCLPIL